MTLPQIWEIYSKQDAGSVSLISWLSYLTAASFWILYGIVHKEKIIIIINSG